MKKIILTLALITYLLSAYSQQVFNAIIIDDKDKTGISNVSIVVHNSTYGTTTDDNGSFSLNIYNETTEITITCLGYSSRSFIIDKKTPNGIAIPLKKTDVHLPQANIAANPIINITKQESLFVMDYEFVNNNILMLCIDDNTRKTKLHLINDKGITISSTSADNQENIEKLCNGEIYTLDNKKAYFLDVQNDSSIFKTFYTMDINEFKYNVNTFSALDKPNYYLNFYHYKNQLIQYIRYDESTDESYEICQISDDKDLRMLQSEARFNGGKILKGHEARFIDEFVYAPIYAPAFVINDSIRIFNFIDNYIATYNSIGDSCSRVNIDFHHKKGWKKEIIVDEDNQNAYAKYMKNGITYLSKIDIYTGKITDSYRIPNFVYIDNIKINNNYIYFLYKENTYVERTKLYKISLVHAK